MQARRRSSYKATEIYNTSIYAQLEHNVDLLAVLDGVVELYEPGMLQAPHDLDLTLDGPPVLLARRVDHLGRESQPGAPLPAPVHRAKLASIIDIPTCTTHARIANN